MTTETYEERLSTFAAGKRLRRFRGTLRHPYDTTCDACGSALPTYLYGVRDMETKSDYFVGANCLMQLSQLGALERSYARSNITNAYLAARRVPQDGAAPRDAKLAASHPCCIHGGYREGHEAARATGIRTGAS